MRNATLLVGLLLLAGCAGRQSVLDPAGEDARDLFDLFRVMVIAALLLWGAVALLFIYVTRINVSAMPRKLAETLIVGGGIVFPVLLLGALLAYSLPMMGAQRQEGDGLVVRITAEQWWWRVEYLPADGGTPVIAANELRLPVGARSELILNAHNVIHSFWVPALGGKTDMIPGRETRMSLKPERTGVFRGQCAEFCGASHALMAFETVAMAPQDFDAWLAEEARDAAAPGDPLAQAGAEVFAREGCGACHAIRGTEAIGRVGPDLTHVGARKSLGAGILPMERGALMRWIGHAEGLKPEVKMPSFDYLEEDDLRALAAYLEGLT
ncbi:c-type cytochrome [Sulfitobacter aestuarii]|uniref:C-type cytochrome n=1 Tax=Sulfitobacter aestuarii TaxID=2161676 RepID=A0ABW5U337_9RHOB